MATMTTPPAEHDIDSALVSALLEEQQPDLAKLPIGESVEGWDNVIFRLGEDFAVRLPRRALAAELSATELDHLPMLARGWAFPAPVPLRIGVPGCGYPWRWSVVPWLQGAPAFDAPLADAGARDLGVALAQVHRSEVDGAPHNPYRSGTLAEVAEQFDARLRALVEAREVSDTDADAVRAVFEEGAATEEPERTWCHLDLHGGNVVTKEGRLAGILDWGDAAAADPGTDLGQACVLVGAVHAQALLEAYNTAEGPMRVGNGGEARLRINARAAAYAVTLASFANSPHREAGLRAVGELVAHANGEA